MQEIIYIIKRISNPCNMKTELQIRHKIKEIEADIEVLKVQTTDNFNEVADNVMRKASISAAKKQIQLLEWVLKG